MAEEESEAVRCLAQLSDANALALQQESAISSEEKEGTNPTSNDHNYVECASGKQQYAAKLDIVNAPASSSEVPAMVGGLCTVTSSSPLLNRPAEDEKAAEDKPDHGWNKIGTWSTPYKGYFTTTDELEQVIRCYTEETESRWTVSAKDKLFGSTDIKVCNFKLFWRGREDDRKAAFPDFDGLPFIMIGRKTWGCHLGRDKCRSGKIKYRTKMQEESQESETGKWPITRSSKKLGCPALITSVHVLKFHEYPIQKEMSEFHRKQLLKSLRQSLLSKHSIVKAEQRFYVNLAPSDEHIHEGISYNAWQEDNSNSVSVKVDRSLIYKITELHHAGMFRLADVSRVLDDHRKQQYKDQEPPSSDHVPELYPNHNVIHFFISHAIKVTSILELDLGRGHRLVSGWQTAFPNDSWYYQPFASSGPIKRARNKRDRLLVGHYPDLSQTFLFCCQNAAQRHLLDAYGTVCLLDSPYGKTIMPTYFLQVRTHVGYQVVGTVIMQYWSSKALAEALQVIKDWNPEWQPQAMMVDMVEEEVEALQQLFPDCKVLISSVHRERAWLDYLDASEGEDRSSDSALLDALVYAGSEEELEEARTKLKESPLWTQNHRLRHWMQVRWLPHIERWSHAFLNKPLLITLFVNDGLARLREALVYDWLEAVRSRTLTELLTSLIMEEIPKLYESYCEENKAMATSNRYQFCSRLPVYIRHQPAPARAHNNELISSLPPMKVTKTSEGKFLVRRAEEDAFEHQVDFGSEEEFPSCDCWMWSVGMEICEHICAVFKECPDWHWCQLSTLYTGNPLFALDHSVLDIQPRGMPRCNNYEDSGSEDNPDLLQVSMDDFGAEEVLEMEAGTDGNDFASTWQLDHKQNTCKGLLDQLSALTEQTKDPEAMDYMTNNLVLLLRQMQGKKDEAPLSPSKQSQGRKRLRSGQEK